MPGNCGALIRGPREGLLPLRLLPSAEGRTEKRGAAPHSSAPTDHHWLLPAPSGAESSGRIEASFPRLSSTEGRQRPGARTLASGPAVPAIMDSQRPTPTMGLGSYLSRLLTTQMITTPPFRPISPASEMTGETQPPPTFLRSPQFPLLLPQEFLASYIKCVSQGKQVIRSDGSPVSSREELPAAAGEPRFSPLPGGRSGAPSSILSRARSRLWESRTGCGVGVGHPPATPHCCSDALQCLAPMPKAITGIEWRNGLTQGWGEEMQADAAA